MHVRHAWLAFVLLLAAPRSALAAAAPPALPTPALQSAFQEERRRGVERSQALAEAVVLDAARSPAERREALYQLAAQLDPVNCAPHLARARLALRRGDPAGACGALADAWQTLTLDAHQEALWLRALARTAHALLAAALATFAALLLLRCLPLARHVLAERLGSKAAATFLLVVPILGALVTSPALGTLVSLVAFACFWRRRERATLAVLCALLAGMDLSLWHLAPHAILLDPGSRSAQIAALGGGASDPELERELAAVEPRSPEIELVLGLQARRRGDLNVAHARFMACLRADSTCAAAYVNISNLFFRAGEYERAAAGYRAAQSLSPADPVPYANLAQTYIRMLHYGESDGELRAASARGFEALARRLALWRDEDLPILDRTLSKSDLLRIARREALGDPAVTRRLLQSWRCGLWRNVRLDCAPWLLLGVAALLFSKLRLRTLVASCPECATVMCAHCVAQSPDEDACPSCQVSRPRAALRPLPGGLALPPLPGETAPRLPAGAAAQPPRRYRPTLTAGRWLAWLFPGAADLVRGAPVAALASVVLGWLALFAALAGVEAARLRAVPWYVGVDRNLLQIALVLFGLAYLPGLLRLRRRERRYHVRVQLSGA